MLRNLTTIYMKKKSKITFIALFVLSFFIVGYIRQTWQVKMVWADGVTFWEKCRYYYIEGFWGNIISALVIALIPTWIVEHVNRAKE